jgi:hypothetical protein
MKTKEIKNRPRKKEKRKKKKREKEYENPIDYPPMVKSDA